MRTLLIIALLVLSPACFGQSSFQEITPGTSTRSDVARVFGQPLRTISATRFELSPPDGIAKLEVEYRAGSAIVERIEVYFDRPISRAALTQSFKLPQQPDAKTNDAEGRLVEYFGESSLLVLTYASADVTSGIQEVGYCSGDHFDIAVSKIRPGYRRRSDATTTPGSGKTANVGRGSLSVEYDTDRPGADYRDFDLSSPLPESCGEACANDPKCRAYTYVKPGVQGPSARCWLKSSVTVSAPRKCCVSGIKR